MMRFRLLLPVLLLFSTGLQTAWAQSVGDTASYPLTANRVQFEKTSSEYGVWLDLGPTQRLAQNPALRLVMSASELIRRDLSNVTLSVNGLPVSSRRLDLAETDTMVWSTHIPKHVLVDGYNRIGFTWRMSSGAEPCLDRTDPALWATIEPSSRLEVEYRSDEATLADFPKPFIYADALDPVRFSLAVADPSSLAETEAALNFGVLLGNHYRFSALPLQVAPVADSAHAGRVIVFEQASAAAVDSTWVTDASGSYSLGWQNSDTGIELRVRGTTPAAMLAAMERLFTKTRTETPREEPPSHTGIAPADTTGPKVTFRSLGAAPLRLAGVYGQRGQIALRRPQHAKVGPGSYIDLIYSHTANLRAGTSSLTVLINDKPAASVSLGNQNPMNQHLRVPIPTEELSKPLWVVQLVAYHDFGNIGEIDCTVGYEEAVWTEVSDLSEIRFGLGTFELQPDLANLPWLQPAGHAPKDTVTFLVDLPSAPEVLRTAMQMAVRVGQMNGSAYYAKLWHSGMHTDGWLIHLPAAMDSPTWSAVAGGWLWRPEAPDARASAVFQTFLNAAAGNQTVYSIYADASVRARVNDILAHPDSARLVQGRVTRLHADGAPWYSMAQNEASIVYSDDKTTWYLLIAGLAALLAITVAIGYFIRHKRRQPRFKPIG